MKGSVALMFGLWLFSGQASFGDQEHPDTKTDAQPVKSAAADEPTEEGKKSSGAAKRVAKDQAVAALVEEHNEAVESELDELVCERVRVTGTRRKVQVCKTKREIAAETESAKRMLLQRNKAGSDPAQGTGIGSTN